MIDGSRRARIAKGSGRQVSDVNQLVDRFFEARKMMQPMMPAAAACPGMPGMPGMPAPVAGKRGKAKRRRRRARASAPPATPPRPRRRPQRRRRPRPSKAANPFGNPGEDIDYEKAAAALDLPKDFSKFLK